MSHIAIARPRSCQLAMITGFLLLLATTEPCRPLLGQELDESRYEVAADATPDQLLRVIRDITEFKPQTFAEYRLHLERAPDAIDTACKLILDAQPDPQSTVYRVAKLALIRAHTIQAPFKDEAFHRTLVDELTGMVAEFGASNETYSLCKLAVRAIRQSGSIEVAIDANRTLGASFEEAQEPRLVLNGRRMSGVARRLSMIGEPFELEGTTLAGQPLDWEAFRGNWTIVYFWSTSVGPAESEVLKLKELSDQYRGQGLQVVAVSMDVKQQVVDEFLAKRGVIWPCLFEEFAGWEHPMALRYGIDELPHAIVVDENGLVISSGDSIPELGQRLSEKYGSAGN